MSGNQVQSNLSDVTYKFNCVPQETKEKHYLSPDKIARLILHILFLDNSKSVTLILFWHDLGVCMCVCVCECVGGGGGGEGGIPYDHNYVRKKSERKKSVTSFLIIIWFLFLCFFRKRTKKLKKEKVGKRYIYLLFLYHQVTAWSSSPAVKPYGVRSFSSEFKKEQTYNLSNTVRYSITIYFQITITNI